MPAEIDTGGPRVLHCDYRADCPIPIVESASTESSLRRENRVVRSSIARRRPRIDESESLDDTTVLRPRRCSGLPCRRTEHGSSHAGSRGFRRRPNSTDPCSTFAVPDDSGPSRTLRSTDPDRDGCCREQAESRLRESEGDARLSRGACSTERHRFHRKRGNDKGHGRGCCWKRDSPHENWSPSRFHAADRVRIGKTPFSSQSGDPSTDRTYEKLVSTGTLPSLADETWREIADATNSWRRGDSRVAKVEVTGDQRQTEFPRFDEEPACSGGGGGGVGGGSRRTRKKRHECSNSRSSCFQLAFLLFLVAFGQTGLLKSCVLNCSVRPSTTGLSVLAFGTVISAVSAAPVDLMSDAGVRAERSANLSHITGASRKIQMYIKNRHLQILPDGTVNGSNDDTSDYTIFQRTSVSRGQLRIQGVATCLYLCMDSCGLLYGSREYTEDCVFNETLEQHNYNTYSSAKWSTAKKTLYLGLNRRGQPRRVQAKGHNLGRLSAYARVLTQVAPLERVEALQRRMLGAHHNVRHRHNSHGQHHYRGDVIQQSLCPTLPTPEKDGRDKFRCRKRKKRKKRKRRCRPGEKPGPQCQILDEGALPVVRSEGLPSNGTSPESKRSCEGAASEEACRREALSVPSKKRKLRVEEATEGAANGRNVTSNGKSKAPASNAKKVSTAGSTSQSKKPNLTDGKKKKKKGPAAARRKPAGPQARKRFTPGRPANTSAVHTATSEPIFATSSSSWWSPGASTAPSGRGTSHRRRVKPTSFPRNDLAGSKAGAAGPRRVGKAFARNRTKPIDRVAVTSAYETTTILDPSSQSMTVKVPETDRSVRASSPSSVELSEVAEDTSRSLSESLSSDEDPSSTVSSEHATTMVDSTAATSIEATSTPVTFRLTDPEARSVEDVDDADDDERFDTSEAVQSTTPAVSIERLTV